MEEKNQRVFDINVPQIFKELPPFKSDSLIKWLKEEVFKTRYIFYNKEKKEAICSHCGCVPMPPDVKHDHIGTCPVCKKKALYKSAGIGRGKLISRVRVMLFQKKGKSIYVTTNFIYADYSQGEMQLYKDIDAVFKFNRKMQQGYATYYSPYYGGRWDEQKNIRVPFRTGTWSYVPLIVYTKNLKNVFKGTDLKYCQLAEQVSEWYPEEFLKLVDLNAKYESVEKLHKVGLDKIIRSKIEGGYGSGAVKWKKTTLKEILGLNREEITKAVKAKITMAELDVYKASKKLNIPFSLESKSEYSMKTIRSLKNLQCYAAPNKIIKYVRCQRNKQAAGFYFTERAIQDYVDYIKECQILNLDLENKEILFPKDLIRAHHRTSVQIKATADKEQNKAIQKRAQEYIPFAYTYAGLCIRVAESAAEIIEEGKRQEHCVGGYTDKVASGKSLIFFLRRADAPDQPYYTLELCKEQGKYKVAQCRGFHNYLLSEPEERAKDAFILSWLENVVNKKKRKKAA